MILINYCNILWWLIKGMQVHIYWVTHSGTHDTINYVAKICLSITKHTHAYNVSFRFYKSMLWQFTASSLCLQIEGLHCEGQGQLGGSCTICHILHQLIFLTYHHTLFFFKKFYNSSAIFNRPGLVGDFLQTAM